MTQVRVAIHGRDGQQAEPLVGVGQPLQRVRQHFAQDLVDPRRPGVAAGGPTACSSATARPVPVAGATSAVPGDEPVPLAGDDIDLGE